MKRECRKSSTNQLKSRQPFWFPIIPDSGNLCLVAVLDLRIIVPHRSGRNNL